jgi:IPT/TIG domain
MRPTTASLDAAFGPRRGRLAILTALALLAVATASATPAGAERLDVRSALKAGPLTATVPTVRKLSHTSGPRVGGTQIAIAGTGFEEVTAVDFGETPATSFTVKRASAIDAVAPAGTGTVDVTVTTAAGTSATSAGDRFTYVASEPAIDHISPEQSRARGGAKIHISGTNLTAASAVDFGETPASSFTVSPPNLITAVAPRGEGTVDIRVTTPEGTTATSPSDRFTYVGKPPSVEHISPNKGPAAGGTTVTIDGSELFFATSVTFGETPAASFVVNPDGSITAVSPGETASRVEVTVTTPYGSSIGEDCVHAGEERELQCAKTDLYKFLEPTITSISPAGGPAAGGTTATLTGTGFAPGKTSTHVEFGNVPATSVECTSSTTCTVVTPAHRRGTAKLKLVVETNQTTHFGASPAETFSFE